MSQQVPTRTRSEDELREIARLGAEELAWDASAAEVVAFAAKHPPATTNPGATCHSGARRVSSQLTS